MTVIIPWLTKFTVNTAGAFRYIIQYGCILHCTFEYLADFIICTGPSMDPTITDGSIVFTEHISVRQQTIQKGDVIIARNPLKPKTFICKRVIAMDGDKVYTPKNRYKKVPRGHVWLEGDRKDNSTDSRDYGPVPYGLIRSRVFFKLFPFHDMGYLRMPADS